jgi:hypothetical protein
MVEAAGLLADGAPEVMLVCYDEALPTDYASFRDDAPCSWVWAWRVARPAANDAKLSLHVSAADADDAEPNPLPASLQVMRHFLAGDASLVQQIDGRRWEWQRHG